MRAIMRCLFRFCCDAEESGDDYTATSNNSVGDRTSNSRHALEPVRMEPMSSDSARYQVAPTAESRNIHEEEEFPGSVVGASNRNKPGGDIVCCHPNAPENNHIRGIREFLRRLRDSWHNYESLEANDPNRSGGVAAAVPPDSASSLSDLYHDQPVKRKSARRPIVAHPLRPAVKFGSERGVPTIQTEEVVLPGSPLQKEMSLAVARTLEEQADECVICMEVFDATNPRMPTLCGCGANKTYFHLPCLYQWIEQSRNCPSCRQPLRWEEF